MIVDETRIAFDNAIRQEHKVTLISGSDEAGRGAMAGPIVVASVILPADYANPAINDSKLIPSKLREQLFTEIVEWTFIQLKR
jgi:ribonuclease HII